MLFPEAPRWTALGQVEQALRIHFWNAFIMSDGLPKAIWDLLTALEKVFATASPIASILTIATPSVTLFFTIRAYIHNAIKSKDCGSCPRWTGARPPGAADPPVAKHSQMREARRVSPPSSALRARDESADNSGQHKNHRGRFGHVDL